MVVVVEEECGPQQTQPVALALPESLSSPYSPN
jgi:hypothetical protein